MSHRSVVRSLLLVPLFAGVLAGAVSRRAGAYVDRRVRGRAADVIAAGVSHAFVLEHGGAKNGSPATLAWGTNASGELGNGGKAASVPRPIETQRFAQVAAGQSFTVALDFTGALFGWGVTSAGQTGVRVSTTAVPAPTPVGTTVWKSIAAGNTHACGITGGGQLYCWGDNSMGELGQGTTGAGSATPAPVGSSTDRWVEVACGNVFTLGLKADGTAWAWGANSINGTPAGQLGINDTASLYKSSPKQIGTGHWVALAAGGAHGLGIFEDGTLYGWGHNTAGEVGNNSKVRKSLPVPVGSGTFVAITAGALDSFAIRSDGALFAWGDDTAGQLGCTSCSNPQTTPASVGTNYQYVAAGADFTVAVDGNGSLLTWGNNASGQLGRPGTAGTPTVVPDTEHDTFVGVKPPVLASGSALGENPGDTNNGARIKSTGVLEMWGRYGGVGPTAPYALGLATGQTGTINQLADCDTTDGMCFAPVAVAYVHNASGTNAINGVPYLQVATGATSTLAIGVDGKMWGWGSNKGGELGNGTTSPSTLPAAVTNPGSAPWYRVSMDSAGSFVFAIQADGTLWGWGYGNIKTPTKLCTSGACNNKHFAMVSTDGDASFAIATNGTLWGWAPSAAPAILDGSNSSGTKDWAGLTWIDVQAHQQDGGAIDSGGNQWGWGYNYYGQIGDGVIGGGSTSEPLPIAEDVKVLANAANVVACSVTMGSLDAQGVFWGWGSNGSEETGLTASQIVWPTNAFTGYQPHTKTYQSTQWAPYNVSASAITCGGSDAFVADQDGWVWAMGLDDNGQLGYGGPAADPGAAFGTQDTPYYPNGYEPNGGSASVDNADAGCPNTGCVWSTGGNQTSGQWYQIDLGPAAYQYPRFYTGVRFWAGNAANYPRQFKVSVSADGSSFTQVATATGTEAAITVPFPLQGGRYIRMQLAASASAPWDIGAINVLY